MKNYIASSLFLLSLCACGSATTADGSKAHGNGVNPAGQCEQPLIDSHNTLAYDAQPLDHLGDNPSPADVTSADLVYLNKVSQDCQSFLAAYPDSVCDVANATTGKIFTMKSSDTRTACDRVSTLIQAVPGTTANTNDSPRRETRSTTPVYANSFPNVQPAAAYSFSFSGDPKIADCTGMKSIRKETASSVSFAGANTTCTLALNATQANGGLTVQSMSLSVFKRSDYSSQVCSYSGVLIESNQNISGVLSADSPYASAQCGTVTVSGAKL